MELVELREKHLSNYHQSFFRGSEVKSVLEFSMPEDAQKHRECLNGPALNEVINQIKKELEDSQRESHGTTEGVIYQQILVRINDLLAEKGIFRTAL